MSFALKMYLQKFLREVQSSLMFRNDVRWNGTTKLKNYYLINDAWQPNFDYTNLSPNL